MDPDGPHILLFEDEAGGHRGQYVRQIIAYWLEQERPGRLTLSVPERFMKTHDEVVQLVRDSGTDRLSIAPFPDEPLANGSAAVQRATGRLLQREIDRHRPDHTLCMHFDRLQIPLATDLRFDFETRISGIYFRPAPQWSERRRASSTKEWVFLKRKKLLLKRAMRNPHLHTLFSLNPYVLDTVQGMSRRVRIVALADGVPVKSGDPGNTHIREDLGIESGRKLALLFGSITARKGSVQLLESLPRLPAGIQPRLAVAFVGRVHDDEREPLSTLVERVRSETAVQIVVDDRFVSEDEIQPILAAADLILLPYQHHLGSSGVLIRAAMAARPVLGSDFGLVGMHIKRHRLGAAVNATSPYAMARGMESWLEDPLSIPFDADRAREFAAANSAEAFSETLFEALLV
jgi:glycosyltransferase involved in cell wall biosynthesis